MTSATGKQPTLQQLENHGNFIGRHIGPDQHDIDAMLDDLGCTSLDALMDEVMPKSIRRSDAMALPQALNETEMLARLRELAQQNEVCHNMIGLGYHDTLTPPVIKRSLLENPGWYTAYTPYQAEISQGRLQALLNYQQMVMDLTGMPLANGSLLDEPSAAAEAMAMLQRINKRNQSSRFLVADDVLPQTLAVLRTRAHYFGIEVVSVSTRALLDEPGLLADCFGVLLAYPGVDGGVTDLRPLIEAAHSHNALVGVASDLLALVMLTPPGEMDADVVIGSSQRFGVQPGFGGPHAAFFATREDYARRVPGRIIGVSKDRLGQPALRMALQTREQHIRREKAMSNICTAQALLAIIAGFYAVYHGAGGLRTIAGRVHRLTQLLAVGLRAGGWKLRHVDFFDTLFIEVAGEQRAQIIADAAKLGINLRRDEASGIGISLNECSTREHVQKLWQVFAVTADIKLLDDAIDAVSLPAACRRQSDFLQHEVFCRYRSETELLRYLKRLENRDVSLTHSMISLGSCTMKLNAAAEMEAVTWPEFAGIHPFAPNEQTRGYRALISELEDMLKTCTGYDAVSLQPNAGSQGEYAGLLAIRAWHSSRGDDKRDICLIPQSAHGTNPASAQMAGMRIVIIGCDDDGNIDVDELKAKAEQHSEQLAALMITYPSTHGVFEERITEICDIMHEHGGQVYLDGANLNALVGWSAPGQFGADVSHLNLHKTFCIPHGGGGPGVGPVCVRQHLAEFLPAHPLQHELTGKLGPVSGTPWGSAGILPISWAYITLMGRDGLRRATQVAILNANYLAKHINADFKVLYSGRNNRIAHECIIDLRPCKQASGISEEDIAKRLIDYGFHAPTMSWPVPGTLMIEPTESEGKAELDRFITAMHGIRNEIRMIEQGQLDKLDNPLKNAPLTVAEACSDDWPHGYSRSQAAWPVAALHSAKYWPPVARVDNVHGDRNLVCSCPPLSDYAEAAPQTLREAG